MKIVIKAVLLIGLVFSSHAQQVCYPETEIPSSTPDSRFIDNGDGTISDIGTGLMWQKCSRGVSGSNCESGVATPHNWLQALEVAQSSNLAGYSDWRLPNITELSSIVEERCYNPSINSSYFPNTASVYYWSASPFVGYIDFAWYVNFHYGDSYYYVSGYRYSSRRVRLVRFEPPQTYVTKRSDR